MFQITIPRFTFQGRLKLQNTCRKILSPVSDLNECLPQQRLYRILTPDEGRQFLLLQIVLTGCRVHLASYQCKLRDIFPGVQRPGHQFLLVSRLLTSGPIISLSYTPSWRAQGQNYSYSQSMYVLMQIPQITLVLFYDYTFRRKGYHISQQYTAVRFCGGSQCICCEVETAF